MVAFPILGPAQDRLEAPRDPEALSPEKGQGGCPEGRPPPEEGNCRLRGHDSITKNL